MEDTKDIKKEEVKVEEKKVDNKPTKPFNKKSNFKGKRPSRFKKRNDKEQDEFEQKIVDLARVTRVMAGGKRMRFRACMVIGDKKGRIGIGLAKGSDVAIAIGKSIAKAKKNIINVPIIDGTIPHQIEIKNKASRLLIKPGRKGSGLKAGGVLRIVLELAGVKDVVAKIMGTNNKVNNAKTALLALSSFKAEAVENAKKLNSSTKKENK